jgi:hypothetical protein
MRADVELRLDGNAAAGLIGQLFTFEVTAAAATCDGCGGITPVGALVFYDHEMGAILRCPGCEAPMIRATRLGGVWRVDMRGVRLLRVDGMP